MELQVLYTVVASFRGFMFCLYAKLRQPSSDCSYSTSNSALSKKGMCVQHNIANYFLRCFHSLLFMNVACDIYK